MKISFKQQFFESESAKGSVFTDVFIYIEGIRLRETKWRSKDLMLIKIIISYGKDFTTRFLHLWVILMIKLGKDTSNISKTEKIHWDLGNRYSFVSILKVSVVIHQSCCYSHFWSFTRFGFCPHCVPYSVSILSSTCHVSPL